MPRVAPRIIGLAVLAAVATARADSGVVTGDAADAGAGASDAEARADDASLGVALSGPVIRPGTLRPAPATVPLRACSFRRALCVHAPAHVGAPAVLATLAAAERAWETAAGALDLPTPDADLATGAYDVYLAASPALAARTVLATRDARGPVDRASAFTLLDARLSGCSRDRAVARELLRAILARTSPAMDDGSARAQTSAMAELVEPCARADAALFQAHPERAFVDAWPEAPAAIGADFGDGAGLAYRWLDATFAASPGAVLRALWALSPSATPLGAFRWKNDPDTFAVLRTSMRDAVSTGSTLDDVFRELAVARALDGARLDWDVPWPDKPRRLASPPAGVAPAGASVVAIRRAGAGEPSGNLRVELDWETHAKMRWAIVKLDAAGRELGHLPIPTTDRATSAQMSLVGLEAVATVLVVGANAGDAAYPFDPDDEAWEPHGWLLTIARE